MKKLNKSFIPNTLVVLDFDEIIIQFNNFDNIFDFCHLMFPCPLIDENLRCNYIYFTVQFFSKKGVIFTE